ncbi:auxin efflux carrier [Limosilactobacillus coleohominis 101-4-CHN]|uniref:Auxin efflux carrier n=1 Tax=Limosilactobacillus coleohominis 101-4-CHN TaxID=575594 RepID=C7XVL1_9LACO|nr:AEC family transporter [Limosilactobacillus coleohominis]EEU30377.1 auxin efflux carrier [Limosilactobacillus coleohominis 101-4-CHN]
MSVFLTSVSSVVEIVLIMALGYILRRNNWFTDSFGGNIASLITKISLPASIFMSVMKYLTKDKLLGLGIGIIFPALAVIVSYLVAFAAVKLFKIRPGRRGIFINAVANANTIFIGMPLNTALFGNKAMSYFLIYYIVNTVSTWAFGVYLIQNDDPTADGQKKQRDHINWSKLLPMPLVGFIFSIIFLLIGIPVPNFIGQTLSYVGSLVTPLSLIYIGIVLYDAGLNNFRFERDSVLALIGRFIISPLALIILIKLGMGMGVHLPSLMRQTLVVQSATPMLAVLPILAKEAHGDVKYATDVVVMSTVLFVVVVPILMAILQFV